MIVRKTSISLFFAIIMLQSTAYALELPLSLAMQRPMVAMAKQGDIAAWIQYDEFSPQFDYFNFRSKTGTTSTIDSHTTWFGGVTVAATDTIRLSYQYSRSQQLASRTKEPLSLNTRYTGHEIRVQYTAFDHYPFQVQVGAGFRLHKSDVENFYRYFVGTSTSIKRLPYQNLLYRGSTGNIETTDGSPLATFATKDSAELASLRMLYEPFDGFNISFGGEVRRVTVQADFIVPALRNGAVSGAIANSSKFQSFQQDIPQSTPWHETHILLQASFNWQPFGESITLGADLTHYQIKRTGYIPSTNPNRLIQYTSADQFDGYIFWQAMKHVALYGHGRASTRYLLGDLPLAYNSRSNHRFNNPYGFLSAGGVVSF